RSHVTASAAFDSPRAEGEDWVRAGRTLVASGVTGYLATICSMPLDRYDDALTRITAAPGAAGAREAVVLVVHREGAGRGRGAGEEETPGVHLEGRFLGAALGAHPPAMVRPMDVEWLAGLL